MRRNESAELVPLIHGDFWFSNILFTYQDTFVFIDMKGQVDDVLSLGGDKYYDYGKLLQSIVGYDLILNGCHVSPLYIETMKEWFYKRCRERGLNVDYLRYVTKGLLFGTFHFMNKYAEKTKQKIWNLIKSI